MRGEGVRVRARGCVCVGRGGGRGGGEGVRGACWTYVFEVSFFHNSRRSKRSKSTKSTVPELLPGHSFLFLVFS